MAGWRARARSLRVRSRHVPYDLVRRLKCTKCGVRQIGLTYTPTVRPTGNPYLREKDAR
jgi:hypothetical protein